MANGGCIETQVESISCFEKEKLTGELVNDEDDQRENKSKCKYCSLTH